MGGGGVRPGRRGGELGGGLLRRQQDGRPGAAGPGKVAQTRSQFLCSAADRTDRVWGETGWRQDAQTAFEGEFAKGKEWLGAGVRRGEEGGLTSQTVRHRGHELRAGHSGARAVPDGRESSGGRRRTRGRWPGVEAHRLGVSGSTGPCRPVASGFSASEEEGYHRRGRRRGGKGGGEWRRWEMCPVVGEQTAQASITTCTCWRGGRS